MHQVEWSAELVDRTGVVATPAPQDPAAYLTGFHQLQGRYTRAFERLAALDRNPQPPDAAWRVVYRAALEELLTIGVAAYTLRPPPRLGAVHRRYLQAVEAFSATAILVLDRLLTSGTVTSEAAVASMREGIDAMNVANELLDATLRS